MKQIYTLLLALVASLGFAQSALNHNRPEPEARTFQFNKAELPFNSQAIDFRWYCYGETMNALLGNTSKLYGNNLFPDSTILVNYGQSGYGAPWIHNVAEVLDVLSINYSDPAYSGALQILPNSTFQVDSVGYLFRYNRKNPNQSIVDTLVFDMLINPLQPFIFVNGPLNTNLGSDTIFYNQVEYDHTTNRLKNPAKLTYKVPLTQQVFADSFSTGLHYVMFSTADLPIAQGTDFVVGSVTFKPGYTWTPNVTKLETTNSVMFTSFKENPGNYLTYTKYDFNLSYFANIDVRYNNAQSWNDNYIPSLAFMSSSPNFNYEHHLIYFKITCLSDCDAVSVKEASKNMFHSIGAAYPNPAMPGQPIIIPVSVRDNSGDYMFTITNSLGQVVYANNNLTRGQNKLVVDPSAFPAGLYICTMQGKGEVSSSRFEIVK